jgi:DNA sulfur modification protein DndD
MLFTKLTVENFGAFRGYHTFDLTPLLQSENPKPVILFGGLNGAGKTTLFESIKICLYGRLYSTNPQSKLSYAKYVKSKILPKNGVRKMVHNGAVELEFSYSSFGQVQNYAIRRFWQVKGDKTEENLRILKNGKILSSVEKENSQAFLMNLIPRGLTDLFFFDGEKIQSLAHDQNNVLFKESFDSILGLDAIHKLQNDLRIYQSRLNQEDASKEIKESLDCLKIRKSQYSKEYESLFQQRAKKESDKDYIHSRIEMKEIELANLGGAYASKRETTKKQITDIEEEISVLRAEIRNICASLFPFAIVPELCTNLRNKLVQEQIVKMQDSAKLLLEGKIPKFLEKTRKQILSQYDLNNQEKDTFLMQISETFKNVFLDDRYSSTELIHDFSETELSNIISWIDQSLSIVPSEIIEKTKRLEISTSKRRNLEDLLQRVPKEELIAPLVKEINLLHQNYGAVNVELNKLDEKLASNRHKLSEIERELDLNYRKLDEIKASSRSLELLKQAKKVLPDFADVLRKRKIDSLANNFTLWLNRLMHKENFVSRVIISPDDYSIKLQQSNGNYISKSELSDGEKQIYAVAMLMALARTSGHSLPFIIDTPLARLDSSHRKNVVSEFIPYASHQVIMFSTDTEVNKQHFRTLSPYISRVYHLSYDPDKISTVVKEEYFWRKEAVIHN